MISEEARDSRQLSAEAAISALENCHPAYANAICWHWLREQETNGPRSDPFGFLYSEALFWADVAPAHELIAYVTAGLERLRGHCVPVAIRKQLFVDLWDAFDGSDQQAFLRRVSGGRND